METILSRPAKILSQSQREAYFSDGFIGVEHLVGEPWLSRLQDVTAEFIDISRGIEGKDKRFDLEPNHNADEPRIRRLNSPTDFHETYWEFASQGPFVDVAEDLLGPNVKFHHSKLNFKWSGGGEEVRWHQDIQFWPHTDFSPLTIGVYLDDVDDSMGPMGVIPSSHKGTLYNQYSKDGQWVGSINAEDVGKIDFSEVAWLTGPAGSVTVHNCCMVHGSLPNNSPKPRPLLLQTYSRADSYPISHIGANGVTGRLSGAVVGGDSGQSIVIEGRTVLGAPDWSRSGAPTIFGSQQDEV